MMLLVETGKIVVLHVRHAFWQISLTYFAKQQREKKQQQKNKFEASPDLAFSIFLFFKVKQKKKAKQVFKILLKF